MKKIIFTSCLAFTITASIGILNSCDEPDPPVSPETEINDNGKTSGFVKIGNKEFNVRYGYYLYDDDYNMHEIVCTDTDLSDFFKGKSFKEIFSMINIIYMDYGGYDYEVDMIHGGYKITLDSENDLLYSTNKDALFWEWHSSNETGCYFNTDKSGKEYSLDGENLRADTFRIEAYDNEYGYYEPTEEIDLGIKNLSFSIDTTPEDITEYINNLESRGIEITNITDSQERYFFHKYFERK